MLSNLFATSAGQSNADSGNEIAFFYLKWLVPLVTLKGYNKTSGQSNSSTLVEMNKMRASLKLMLFRY